MEVQHIGDAIFPEEKREWQSPREEKLIPVYFHIAFHAVSLNPKFLIKIVEFLSSTAVLEVSRNFGEMV